MFTNIDVERERRSFRWLRGRSRDFGNDVDLKTLFDEMQLSEAKNILNADSRTFADIDENKIIDTYT